MPKFIFLSRMPSGSLYGIYGEYFSAISMKPGSMSISFTIYFQTLAEDLARNIVSANTC